MKYKHTIFIGRMQPVHLAHIEVMKQALQQSEHLIVLVGSSFQPRTIKNPWTIGHMKDESSYYLNMFPQWDLIDVNNIEDMHASDIRDAYFSVDAHENFEITVGRNLPPAIHDFLKAFMLRPEYEQLVKEYSFIQTYQRAYDWDATLDAFLENEAQTLGTAVSVTEVIELLRKSYKVSPYDPQHVTVDSVVVQAGHVLLVRRRAEPGKGLFAAPGGFVNKNETLQDAALRELREETKLKVPAPVLRGSIKEQDVYDSPTRSLRGRTFTHTFLIELPPGELPKVKGGDDADKAVWVPLSTFEQMEDQMFEDHYHMIKDIMGKL